MHDRVHQHSETREVSGIFKQTQHQIERNNIRQNHGEGNVKPAGEKTERLDKVYPAPDDLTDQNVMDDSAASKQFADPGYDRRPKTVKKRVEQIADQALTDEADG